MYVGAKDLFIDPICCNFCVVCPEFEVGFGQSFIFSLRDINLTLGLLPSRRHVVWRNSVSAESSKLGHKSECEDIFSVSRVLSRCYAILKSYNNSETAVYDWYVF